MSRDKEKDRKKAQEKLRVNRQKQIQSFDTKKTIQTFGTSVYNGLTVVFLSIGCLCWPVETSFHLTSSLS
jgi:uncharacterized membrane protein